MQRATYACGTAEHAVCRRGFLGALGRGTLAGGAVVGGLGWLTRGMAAEAMQARARHILISELSVSWGVGPEAAESRIDQVLADSAPAT